MLSSKYIYFLIVLKFSVMLYSKILENSMCRESVSYTFNVTVKCPEFKISNFISYLFMNEGFYFSSSEFRVRKASFE